MVRMAHKPENLSRRSTRSGKSIFYVQFSTDTDAGHRLSAKSTGQTAKAAAEAWSFEQLRIGRVITKKNITLYCRCSSACCINLVSVNKKDDFMGSNFLWS
jgi:hypothetical protein